MIEQLKQDVANKFKDHPKRYEHILGVVKTAISLALRYGVDSNKAYIAAIFHDYTKYDTLTFQTSVLSDNLINKYANQPVMYHALSAAAILKSKYGIDDPEILDAISYHVYGRENMTTLDKIILVADKIEPSRTYPLVHSLRQTAQLSLEQTIQSYLTDLKQRLKNDGSQLPKHIDQIILKLGE